MTNNMTTDHHFALPGKATSLWLDTTPDTDFSPLQKGLTVDVAIIGGGIAGITAAMLLTAEGKTVAVLEARRIVQGVTGHTTAKITSLHTLIYDDLIQRFGNDKAQAYADANQAAIELIARLVNDNQIDCDFTRTEAYTYTEHADEVARIETEVQAALKLGLPATFVTETPMPFPVKAAIRFDHQALFHPRKYLLALARIIRDQGNFIFEETQVTDLEEGQPCAVKTDKGLVKAQDVIIASHFPFGDKMLYASRLSPHRSYVLGVRLATSAPRGMFISPEPSHTLRYHPAEGENFLLVGGEGHKTGHGVDTTARYQRVEVWARERFPIESVEYHWSTQDNKTLDGVPYVGRSTPLTHQVYVATGFGGWGMTNSTAAAMLLRDLIMDRENPWADLYDPNRVSLTDIPELLTQTTNVARDFVSDRLKDKDPYDVAPGEGKVIKVGSKDVALYRAEDGKISTLSPECTHMGCFVRWNSAERSWDCPCHGSRFGMDGAVLHGPALHELEKVDIAELKGLHDVESTSQT